MDETDRLAEALAAEFTDTQLHHFIQVAEWPDHKGDHWQRLQKAAIKAANCDDCRATR